MSEVLTIPAEIVEKGDVLVAPKCFLCDNLIENVAESFDLFEKRVSIFSWLKLFDEINATIY